MNATGDQLDWTWEARNGEMIIMVKKIEQVDNQVESKGNVQKDRKRKKVIKRN